MGRYRFVIEYLGSGFCGWQSQRGGGSVQQALEDAFFKCMRIPIKIIGAGRTDAGVHAGGQVAHFETNRELDIVKIQSSVNAITNKTLYIRRLEACRDDFHARYDARSRLYHYTIALRPTALYNPLVWFPRFPLDFNLLKGELEAVKGEHDFDAFSVSRNDGKPTNCVITRADVWADEKRIVIKIAGNRFLHKMVRSLVGACCDVARGKHQPGLIQSVFDNSFKGEWTWAPPDGLCLKKVEYDDYAY
ncbi:MAG: tRNA pseudouridine(38-40) synthase TruA [Fibrobacteria bacterium]|nr:tRNA pseudouridine(38-40) synthase TruA [Fibrobacteria bacterium]